MEIFKEFRFEAAHRLPNVARSHKCWQLHGHSYRFVVTVEGPVDPKTGMVIDYKDISKVVKREVIDVLDHQYLNDIQGLENPTSEVLSMWIWHRIKELPLKEVRVFETSTAGATYRGQ